MNRFVGIFVLLCILSVIAVGMLQQGTSQQLIRADFASGTCPASPSVADVTAFADARVKQLAIPAGWAVVNNEGKVTVTDTGLVMQPSGERAWTASVVDETPDLDSAALYINSQLVFTATRANGSIIDRSGKSIATLPALVPPSGQTWTGRVEWTATNGYIRSWETQQP